MNIIKIPVGAILGMVLCAAVPAEEPLLRVAFNIAPQPIGPALTDLAEQAGLQVLVRGEDVRTLQPLAKPVNGELTVRAALDKVLANTGLTYKFLNDRTVRVTRQTGVPAQTSSSQEGKSNSSSGFPVAQAASGQATSVSTVNKNNRETLQEIVVTAQRREERLIDTPQSVTALNADELAQKGVTQLRDFADTVPGLTINTKGAGSTQITLRGVTGGINVSSTTAMYIDDVPYGSSTAFGVSETNTLDLAPFDLERIEVLRGPQGTLYGVSSMGGLIKYVTKTPDLNNFGGNAQVGSAYTNDGGISYNVAAAVNLPIVGNKLALRASGFESHDGGYIDNIGLNQKDANRSDTYGGRLDLLFEPISALSVRVSGVLQDILQDGGGTADYSFTGQPIHGSLDQNRLVPEPLDQRFRLASTTIRYDMGPATLTSISAYQTIREGFRVDESALYAPLLSHFFGLNYSSVGAYTYNSVGKFTQEIRLASSASERLDWVVGGFYSHITERLFSTLDQTRDLANQVVPNDLLQFLQPSSATELSGFGDLTWHLTGSLDLTGGLRYARDRISYQVIASGLLAGASSKPLVQTADHVMTYLADIRYHLSKDSIAYLRYATGYRPGGPNFVAVNLQSGVPAGPALFQSDSLKSYEVGYKAEIDNRRFGIDMSVYDIEWSNIQVVSTIGPYGYIVNAPGGARIRGSELMLTARYPSNFVMTSALAYQDPYMKAANEALGASRGERLPSVPKFTAAVTADYTFTGEKLQPTIGVTARYVDARWSSFTHNATSPQYHLPDYAVVDLHAGLHFTSVDTQFYVHNLIDKRGQISALTYLGPAETAIVQPRTIGFTVTTRF